MSQVSLSGYSAKVGYIQEVTYGVAPTTGSYLAVGYNPQVSPKTDQNFQSIYTLGSRDVQKLVFGKLQNEIRIEYYPADVTFAQFGVGNLSGVSFTLWIQVSSYNLVYSGCKIDNIKFEVKVGEPTKITAVVKAQQVSTTAPGTATLPALPTNNILYFGDASVTYQTGGGGAITLPGADYSCEIVNNIEWVPVLGQRFAKVLQEKERKIKGDVNMSFNVTDPTQWETTAEILAPDSFSLVMTLGKDQAQTVHTLTVGVAGSGTQWETQEIPLKTVDIVYVKYPFISKSVALA
jgi:tail tube protein